MHNWLYLGQGIHNKINRRVHFWLNILFDKLNLIYNTRENLKSTNKHKLQMSIPWLQIVNANTGWMNDWAKESTAEPLKGYINSTTYKYKCKYQGWIANLPKTANDLGWHHCLPKCNLTKYGLGSLYILF